MGALFLSLSAHVHKRFRYWLSQVLAEWVWFLLFCLVSFLLLSFFFCCCYCLHCTAPLTSESKQPVLSVFLLANENCQHRMVTVAFRKAIPQLWVTSAAVGYVCDWMTELQVHSWRRVFVVYLFFVLFCFFMDQNKIKLLNRTGRNYKSRDTESASVAWNRLGWNLNRINSYSTVFLFILVTRLFDVTAMVYWALKKSIIHLFSVVTVDVALKTNFLPSAVQHSRSSGTREITKK